MGGGAAAGLFRTELCSAFRATGACLYGDLCSFAHVSSNQMSDAVEAASGGKDQRARKQLVKQRREEMKRMEEEQRLAQEKQHQANLAKFERKLEAEGPAARGIQQNEAAGSAAPRWGAGPPAQLVPTAGLPGREMPAGAQAPLHFPAGSAPAAAPPPAAAAAPAEPAPAAAAAPVASAEVTTARKLALFDEEPWDLVITDSAFARLQKASRVQQDQSLKALKVLASGRWPTSQKETVGSHGPLKLRDMKSGHLHILWSIDVDFSRDRDAFVEVLQVWDVADEEGADDAKKAIVAEWKASKRSWHGVQAALKQQAKDIVANGLRLPRVVDRKQLTDTDVVASRKFFTLDATVLKGLLIEDAEGQGGAVSASEQFPLRISKQEATLVSKPGPLIVIGRSGSGKTLCCVYRMFFQHQEYWKKAIAADGEKLIPHRGTFTHLNQVFVTHSTSLANKVKDYFDNLLQSAGAVGSSRGQDAAAGASRRVRFTEHARLPDDMNAARDFPIFITFRKFLIMVDGTLKRPFFPRKAGGSVNAERVELAILPDALDPISALREQRQLAQQRGGAATGKTSNPLTEVDFDVFEKRFWPKLRQKCPQGCDASLAWREIQSHIKGSYRVLETSTGYLSFEEYCEVARKVSPGFEDYRQELYNAFNSYQELMEKWHCFDRMDACFHVVHRLKSEPYSGPPILSAAVDEVQDLAQLELALFFLVMGRPFDGLFITGDTSQTVSRSVDFRFCDLRSLFSHFKVAPPDLDQLVVNYRSHQKILELSHKGIVRPLEQAFPHAIDALRPDLGHRDGPHPIIVNDVQLEELTKHLFNLDGTTGGIAFGASQCVLVRSEASKARLPEELQRALVLTVEQSKGLEFDDVVLVNFFKDSGYKDWQVMRSFHDDDGEAFRHCRSCRMEFTAAEATSEKCPECRGDLDTGKLHRQDQKVKRPHFERHRHTLLCSELKHLYTGVTRTKHVLLFVEQDQERGRHAFELWREMGLVSFGLLEPESKEAIYQLMIRAGESKSDESWKKMGHNLLNKHLFPEARSAFERAHDEANVKLCDAYLLAQRAEEAWEDSESEGIAIYLRASELFASVFALAQSGLCLRNAGRYAEAARSFEAAGAESYENAAEAYALAGEHEESSRVYLELGKHREALDALVKAEAYDKLKQEVLRAHEMEELPAIECFGYLQDMEANDAAAELYLREGDYEHAATCFHNAGMQHEEADCYLELDKPLKAAEIWEGSGDLGLVQRAAEVYQEHHCTERALACLRTLLDLIAEPDNTQGPSREELLYDCAELHEQLGQWASAAELWEEVGQLEKAAQGYLKEKKLFEAAVVYQKQAKYCARDTEEWKEHMHQAAYFFEKAPAVERAIEIYEELEAWDTCASLAERKELYTKAAKYHLKLGRLPEACKCLASAKSFEDALKLESNLAQQGFCRLPEVQIACLCGLGRHIEAAQKQMELAHSEADASDARKEYALKAFEMAKRDKSGWKGFLHEHRGMMPDPATAVISFLELGATEELIDFWQEEPVLAAGIASLAGQPAKAIAILKEVDCEPILGKSTDEVVLELLFVALLCGDNKPREDSKQLKEACAWLKTRGEKDVLMVEFVEAMLERAPSGQFKGDGVRRLEKISKQIKKPSDGFLLHLESAMASKKEPEVDWVRRALFSIKSLRQKPKGLSQDFYYSSPKLHEHLCSKLDALFWNAKGVTFCTSGELLLPRGHPLSRYGKEYRRFPEAMCVAEKTATKSDLAERRLKLLETLDSLPKRDVTQMPVEWDEARQNAPAGLKERAECGFRRAVVAASVYAHDQKTALSGLALKQLEECANEECRSAVQEWKEAFTTAPQQEWKSKALNERLQERLNNVCKMLRVFHGALRPESPEAREKAEAAVAQSVADLILPEVDDLAPICPHHVHFECSWKKKCQCSHPKPIHKNMNPWFLLNSADRSTQFSGLVGIGLQAWLDVLAICTDHVSGRCNRKDCKYHHLSDAHRQLVRDELKSSKSVGTWEQREKEKLDKMALALRGAARRESAQWPFPAGFGFTFIENEDRARSVRLVSLVAFVLLWHTSPKACRKSKVLSRMLRGMFLYPDTKADWYVRESLQYVSREDQEAFRRLEEQVAVEVDGFKEAREGRGLLRMILNRESGEQQGNGGGGGGGKFAPRSILQRPPGAGQQTLYPPTISRNQQAAERNRVWKGAPPQPPSVSRNQQLAAQNQARPLQQPADHVVQPGNVWVARQQENGGWA